MKKLLGIAAAALAVCMASTTAAVRSDKADISRNLDIFNSLYKELQTFYVDSIDADASINTAIEAMLQDIDPYTEYIPRDKQDDFKHITTGEYAGIGAMIMARDSNVYISEPLVGGPALLAGLRAADRIITIDGDSVRGWSTARASERLRGNAGTVVKVVVARPYAEDSILTFDITRRKIQEQSVPYYGVVRGDIGYIILTSFTDKSYNEVKDALAALKADPRVKSIVLDLRGNGGGLLESAVKIVSLFVPKGTEVLRTRGRDVREEKVYKTTLQPLDTKIPLAVLINEGTASSSEIVSGALQDLDRAVIVGNRSYGKGLVQTSRPLPDEGLLKVTISKYFIPSGRLIQAIDYSRRNPDGSVSRIPDSLTKVFSTAAGREVRDGGGITPDVAVTYKRPGRMTYNVMESFKVTDYATRYAAQHPEIAPAGEFVVSDSIFEDFRTFVNPASVNYDRVLDKMVKNLREAASAEGYMTDSVQAQIDVLATMLHHDPERDFAAAREEIEPYLVNEIVGRYYYRPGEIESALRYDAGLDSAATVLHTPGRVAGILAPVKKKK
ncbi:MAG: S41 family peptidase [Candidatus Amulumruptor caecigallinarius]|nr:S41 family peptidase [Candidatus Amulumruptor caecigallinarius]MCM1396511.1 S41 family peptidase [Candidatus Amulumruptor caecigallinarius]MCM1453431.1 S41 family peptidase [bacterium]